MKSAIKAVTGLPSHGDTVSFVSGSDELVAGDTNNADDAFVRRGLTR